MSDAPGSPAPDAGRLDADWAFARYEAVRPRLPAARFPAAPARAATLAGVADRYDGFVLDAFGVLNIGDAAIPGAVARMAALRARGKRLVVLTNAASYRREAALAKYRRLGFDFTPDEVVSSRDVAAAHLAALAPGALWGAAAAAGDDFADLPARVIDVLDVPGAFDEADAFLLLSSARWTAAAQARLVAALRARPRPVAVANPDLVAPREDGLSREPGAWAHDLADATGVAPRFFGKPFAAAFAAALARLALPAARVAMVGDTLHTDILGAAAAGMGAVLVTRHGLFAGRAVDPYIDRCGIVPDWIVETT